MLKSILQKVQNRHFLSLAGNASMSVLSMISFAILYRKLSVTDIGYWIIFQTAYSLMDTFRSGFLNTAIVTFYAGTTKQRKQEVTGSSWYIASIITGVLSLLTFLFSFIPLGFNSIGVQLFLTWGGLTFIATLPSFIATCLVQADAQFDRFLVIRFISQALFIIMLVTMPFFLEMHVKNVVIANLVAAIITSAFTLFFRWTQIATFVSRTKACVKELYAFGKYSFGSYLSSSLFRTTDNFIINTMLGPAALAVYNLGIRLMEIVEIPLRAFVATALPELSTAYNQQDKQGVIYATQKYIGMLTIALVPACLAAVLLADVAIHIIGGEKYLNTEAANVLRIYMTFALMYPLDRFFAVALDVVKMPKINFYKVLAMLAANVLADYFGVLLFGNIYGIAMGTFFPILIGTLIGYYYLNKYQAFSFMSIFRVGYQSTLSIIKNAILALKGNAKATV